MEKNTVREPSATVFDFAVELPHAIRSDVLVFVLPYAFGETGDARTDFADRLRHHLLQASGASRFGAVLRIVAALDFVLARAAPENTRGAFELQEIAKAAPPDVASVLERALLGMPLRQK